MRILLTLFVIALSVWLGMHLEKHHTLEKVQVIKHLANHLGYVTVGECVRLTNEATND
jgi:hypothetical protein